MYNQTLSSSVKVVLLGDVSQQMVAQQAEAMYLRS